MADHNHTHHAHHEEHEHLENLGEHEGVTKEILIEKDDFEVVRFTISKGARLPKHKAKFNAVMIPIRGTGSIFLNDEKHQIEPGKVVHLTPQDAHSLIAESELEIILVFKMA